MSGELNGKRVAVMVANEGVEQVELISRVSAAGKPISAICHGSWSLIEADVVRGRTMTSWPSAPTDLVNAGASWVDEEEVVCTEGPNPLVWSRNPADLPAFCDALVKAMA